RPAGADQDSRLRAITGQQQEKPMAAKTDAPVIAMRGAGYYSANTVGAKAVIDAAADLVLETMDGMNLTGPGSFCIADYGAADGGTSIDMMRRAVACLRQASSDRPTYI